MSRLKFEDTMEDGTYEVYNHKNEYLGFCEYYKKWKCWTFASAPEGTYGETAFSADCLKEISEFLELKDKEGSPKHN